MYERSYGYRYDEAERYSSPGEIAKLIRRDVKQAQAINYGRERAVVHVLVQTPEGKQVLGCGARAYGARLSRANDDAVVTCSRCARRGQA